MRIGFYFPAVNYGGHEEISCRIIELLCDRFDISIYCSIDNKILIERIYKIKIKYDIKINEFSISNKIGFSKKGIINSLFDSYKLYKILGKEINRPKIIVSVDGGYGASFLSLLAPRILGVKVISYIPLLQVNLNKSYAARLYGKLFVNKCITITKYIQSNLKMIIPKVHLIENPISLDFKTVKKNRTKCTGIKLLYLARIDFNQKCQDAFINFILSNYCELNNISIDFYGDGPDFDSLEGMINEAMVNNIKLYRWKNWNKNFSDYDALVLYSNFEGEPVVFIEAILSGLPVICSQNIVDIELVPEKYTFHKENFLGFQEALKNSLISGSADYSIIKEKLLSNRNIDNLKTKWLFALNDWE